MPDIKNRHAVISGAELLYIFILSSTVLIISCLNRDEGQVSELILVSQLVKCHDVSQLVGLKTEAATRVHLISIH